MKTRLTLYAVAVILSVGPQLHAQDELDSLRNGLATPTPTPARAATPKPTVSQAAPVNRVSERGPLIRKEDARTHAAKPDLAHGHFLAAGDLDALAGKKVPANTFLTGTFRYIGDREESGKRFRFQPAGGLLSAFNQAKTTVLIRFPVHADNKLFTTGYAAKWEQAAPLQIERVEKDSAGLIVYAADVTP